MTQHIHTPSIAAIVDPTIDGEYVIDDEWDGSEVVTFGTNSYWIDQWSMTSGIKAFLLVETADATNGANDVGQLCFEGNADRNL